MSFTDSESRTAEVGSPENPAEITDPRALRALAHPARLTILQHLALDGPATATECAEVTGLSPSACSYHLRTLARYGFVGEEPTGSADRRHRPWRARVVGITLGDDVHRPPAVRAAERLLVQSLHDTIDQMRAEYLDHVTEFPPEWQAVAWDRLDVLHLTAAELGEVRAQVEAILDRYRRLRPQDRPAGARRVHAGVEFLPWVGSDPAP